MPIISFIHIHFENFVIKNVYSSEIQDIQDNLHRCVYNNCYLHVEFGAKISVAMVEGYAFLEKLSWDAYNEAGNLKDHIENYHRRFGYYPESVHVDHIYRNRENRNYCKEKGIKISGPPLGRPPKDPDEYRRLMKGAKESEIERIPIEGKFGNGKRSYGWSRITTKKKNTSETAIGITVLVMNLEKIMKDLLLSIFSLFQKIGIFPRRELETV